MSHSIIAPSSASIWGKPGGCTGWPIMNKLYPEVEPSIESLEGAASHQCGERMIKNLAVGKQPSAKDYVDDIADNGVVINEEIFEGAMMYAEDVATEMRTRGIFTPKVEHRITAPQIHPESFGTVDNWIYDMNRGEVIIWDYKFGYGVVEAFENWQGINYAAGIMHELGIDGIKDQHVRIEIRIVQPRAYHRDGPIRNWKVMASDLRPYINILHNNAHEALSGNSVNRSGSHCRHCSARHACEASLSAGIAMFEVATKPLPMELPHPAIGVQLSIIKRAIKQLSYLESGYEEQIKSLIRSGVSIPGWNVEPTVGHEKWTKPVSEIISLGKLLGVDLKKPEEAISPAKARKLGIDDTVIKAYSEKPKTGIKVIPVDEDKIRKSFPIIKGEI